jgi:PAS domain S-box-containing protein
MSDDRLRRLFDANVVGILIGNNAGSIVEANEAFLRMIGYSRTELEAGLVDWRRLTPPEWLGLDERAIAEMAVRGSFTQYEKEYVRKDGTRVPTTNRSVTSSTSPRSGARKRRYGAARSDSSGWPMRT